MSTLDAAARWYSHALGDLLTAKAILDDLTLPPREAVFLAQQAAEKALKASITTTGSEPPWIHDLVRLRSLAPAPIARASASINLVALSIAATAARNPDFDDRDYDRDEAMDLVADAARIVEIVAEHLRSIGLPGEQSRAGVGHPRCAQVTADKVSYVCTTGTGGATPVR